MGLNHRVMDKICGQANGCSRIENNNIKQRASNPAHAEIGGFLLVEALPHL